MTYLQKISFSSIFPYFKFELLKPTQAFNCIYIRSFPNNFCYWFICWKSKFQKKWILNTLNSNNSFQYKFLLSDGWSYSSKFLLDSLTRNLNFSCTTLWPQTRMWSIAEVYKVPFAALTVPGGNILMSWNSYLEMCERLTKVPGYAVSGKKFIKKARS